MGVTNSNHLAQPAKVFQAKNSNQCYMGDDTTTQTNGKKTIFSWEQLLYGNYHELINLSMSKCQAYVHTFI